MLTKLKALLSRLLPAIGAFAKKNPAAVSWAVSMAVTLAAHYGLHVTPTQLVVVFGVLLTALHGWLHVATRKPS